MAQSFDTSLKNVAGYYLQQLKANVTIAHAQNKIEENPYYPSLLSLSDTFSKFNIPNNAFQVSKENFDQLETPFVAFVNMPRVGRDFVLVKKITDSNVSYMYKSKKVQTISKEEFLSRYQDIIWMAEPNEQSGETDYHIKLKKEKTAEARKILWYASLATLIAIAFIINIGLVNYVAYTLITFLKLAGLATAVLLLIYEMDKSNAFVKNLCSAGGHTNCDAVLSSKGAKVLGISWGEVGFFYFMASTMWLFFPTISFAEKTAWIAMGNAIAAPYIVFSIYYQWKVVKQWCPLCLTVQGILLLELIWGIINFWSPSHPFQFLMKDISWMGILQQIFCAALPIAAWFGIKPLLKKAKDATLFSSAYKRLQYNPDIFNGLLQQQAQAPDGWKQLGIGIGNPNAANTIIKVCNPYCGPCAKAHPALEEIIKHNENVQVKVVFTAKNNENDRGAIIVRHLLAISAQGDQAKTQKALDDWYLADIKDYENFATKYPMNGELKQQDAKIEMMSKWCEEAEIAYTPTIFVNGYRLPENYSVEELENIF